MSSEKGRKLPSIHKRGIVCKYSRFPTFITFAGQSILLMCNAVRRREFHSTSLFCV